MSQNEAQRSPEIYELILEVTTKPVLYFNKFVPFFTKHSAYAVRSVQLNAQNYKYAHYH